MRRARLEGVTGAGGCSACQVTALSSSEPDSGPSAAPATARFVSQLAVRTLERGPWEKAKQMFQGGDLTWISFSSYKLKSPQTNLPLFFIHFEAYYQSSDMYCWLVLVMGVFYAIPALQLVTCRTVVQ